MNKIFNQFFPKSPELDENSLEGMAIFTKFFLNNHILITKCCNDYFNRIKEKKRSYIVYLQNINMWINFLRLLYMVFFNDEKVELLLSNPFVLLTRWKIAAMVILLLGLQLGVTGKFCTCILL